MKDIRTFKWSLTVSRSNYNEYTMKYTNGSKTKMGHNDKVG